MMTQKHHVSIRSSTKMFIYSLGNEREERKMISEETRKLKDTLSRKRWNCFLIHRNTATPNCHQFVLDTLQLHHHSPFPTRWDENK